ncbi:MAG: zinc-ribbon domain-containing protein [Coriobacteriales bacterium]
MHCEKCGSKLDDGAMFCTECGAKVAQNEQAQPSQQSANAKPPRNKLAIPLAIAAIAAVALIIVLVVVLFNQSDKSEAPAATSSSASTAANDPAPTIETELFRITLPEDVASKVSFTEKNGSIDMTYLPTNANLATISAGEGYEVEYKHVSYSLGDVYAVGSLSPAWMVLPYVDANNKPMHWSKDVPVELGITKLLGMTPEQFTACISLNTGSQYVPATPMHTGGDKVTPSSTSAEPVMTEGTWAVPSEPFWGIWTDASKDRAEVEAIAQRIHNETGDKVTVVLTTDWSNLNSEPWYVISMGRWSSQEDADEALPRIQANGYPDAYVKYSGDKVK